MPRSFSLSPIALLACALCSSCCEEVAPRTSGDGSCPWACPDSAPGGDGRIEGDLKIADGEGIGADARPGDDQGVEADAALEASVPAPDAGPEDDAPQPSASAADWIISHLSGAPVMTGDFTSRTTVEAPHLVMNATGGNAKYAFDIRDNAAPNDKEVGFVDVTITDLSSSDAWGAGIVTYDAGMTLYLAGVTIEPNWPMWQGYSTTNKDGIVLDGSVAFYAEDLTIRSWNADSAIDNKAPISQMVRLAIAGPGNRAIRYWGNGPHYLVDSAIDNPGTVGAGALVWFLECDSAELRVYNSTFNGSPTIAANAIGCDSGANPQITYLTTDPRTTGEMHPMFVAP